MSMLQKTAPDGGASGVLFVILDVIASPVRVPPGRAKPSSVRESRHAANVRSSRLR